jgi:hypothetical protein
VVSEVKSLSGRDLRVFKCDGAKYYLGALMTSRLKVLKVRRKVSAPYASQQNAVPESWNRVVDEGSFAQMLYAGNVPSELWAESQNSFVYVLNNAFLVEEDTKNDKGQIVKRQTRRCGFFFCRSWTVCGKKVQLSLGPK